MSIGTQFATRNEVEILRRKLERAISGAGISQHIIIPPVAENFIDLADTPSTYAAAGNFAVRVKSTIDMLEFAELKGTANQIAIAQNAADITISIVPQLILSDASAAPYLKLVNASDTAANPIIQFAVGATPVTKFTMGVDDSDGDKWKLAVGDEFGQDHSTIVVTSGVGSTPGVAEFTLIDTFAATYPNGICADSAYLYYNDGTASQQVVKVDKSTGNEVTRSADAGINLGQCATDGTHVYAGTITGGDGTVLKYLCSDLSYVAVSSTWAGGICGTCYWSGYLYVTNINNNNVRKIRCSDMATIWTTTFTFGGGVDQMARPAGITVDGQYLYVQDCSYGNNRIVRLNLDGTWVDSVAVVNSMSFNSIAMWCAGDYVYDTAWYTFEYKIEKRNKSDLSISETFSMVPDQSQGGYRYGDYHYVVHIGNQFIYKYQYTTSPASATAGIQFRLKDLYGQFVDIAKLTAAGRFGVGTTIPSETIEAVGNIKATAGQFISTKATGTAPVVVSSTTVCTNLNAGLVDGYHHDQSLLIAASPTFMALNLSATSNQIVLQSAGVTGTITATPASSNKVWTLQNVTGTIYQTGGTDVAVTDGGTGKSSFTQYAIPYASAATTISEIVIGAAGKVLAVNGGANGYEWIAAGGAMALDDLTDVNAGAPNDNDFLSWDAGTNRWIAVAGGGGAPIAFADLTDYPADAAGALTNDGAGALSWVPGGGTHSLWFPDAFPGSPTAQSDHFDDASLAAKWHEFDTAGKVVISEANHHVKFAITSLINNHVGMWQTLPSGDFTITAKMRTEYAKNLEAKYMYWGITLFQDATNNPSTCDLLIFHVYQYNNTVTAQVLYWTDYDSYSSAAYVGPAIMVAPFQAIYFRVRRNGTNFYYDLSLDNLSWKQYAGPIAQGTYFTPAEFGITCYQESGAEQYVYCDWIYYQASDNFLASAIGASISI
jgi:hypothetical protein